MNSKIEKLEAEIARKQEELKAEKASEAKSWKGYHKHTNLGSNWVTMNMTNGEDTYKLTAKVYDKPSGYGINEGRVSKLKICKVFSNGNVPVVYSYDRGDDYQNCPDTLIEIAVNLLES